jgi:hypothetical protein
MGSVPISGESIRQGLKDCGEEGWVLVIPGKYYLFIKLQFENKFFIFIS